MSKPAFCQEPPFVAHATQAIKTLKMTEKFDSQEADSADAITEWLQRLQLQLGGAFTWATEETEDGFTINGERYQIEALLGEGSFGSVYRCLCDGHMLAVKVLSTERIAMMTNCSQQVVLRRMLQEAEILGCLGGHPNIVQLRVAAVSQQTLRIYIAMQLLECSDLFSEMLRRRQPFSERDAREALTQVTMAVVHCHRRGVAHRDIKLENLMVASRRPLVVKLIDFGQAVMYNQAHDRMRSIAKTLTTTSVYTPPEVQKATEDHSAYDPFKLDSFAVGVVLYALLLNALPQTTRGYHYEKHPKWKLLSTNAQDLIKQLMEPDPQRRISMADALQHPWLLSKGSGSAPRSSRTHTPLDRDSEMQVLLAAQELNKALQRERGASCWLLSGNEEAENVCRWFCKSTDESYVKLQEGLAFCQLEDQRADVNKRICQMADMTQRLRLECRNLRFVPKTSREDNFDVVFSGYSQLNEDAIGLIGQLTSAFKGPDTQMMMVELKLRMLLHMAEQLGRERGFISFHIGRPEALHSVKAQLRFAKIQGCRQYLVGSSAPHMQPEVVSCAEGLLPSLRLADEPILSTSELQALEAAENSVMQGHRNTSEWFAFLTGMIDKVHQHVGMVIVSFIQEISNSKTPLDIEAWTQKSNLEDLGDLLWVVQHPKH
ncbi:CaMKII [Symbiodinium pilosum]|uniref:CaMKII protein n=1 Tax=Symbiodinium pilosum TaxID=2952 RepID=A0A812P5Z0_SYMPI|nr:CaMKII [Symbiodinium pilosum]